ncbi:MAG: rRNA maturation RNase YbeY [Candidatus Liberibacter ctenarytainae]|uniref:Endoribonuclease YbeY n=1 Tax=Candidatus Liberibacter ctenarytainae TaxID=2020335 RepID=A0A937AJG7_9HYPH|nr:rRNA maturation RNase YbeY [Candidatus Liberibacter ctenarytainae]
MNLPLLDLQISLESGSWKDSLGENVDLRVLCTGALSEAVFFLVDQKERYFVDAIEISLVFTDSRRIKTLNSEYRGIDKPTNVLSFPSYFTLSNKYLGPMLGDIVLAYEVIEKEANISGKKMADHLVHLIMHGFLHLLGYDHVDDERAYVMESLERSILANLGISDPYAGWIES